MKWERVRVTIHVETLGLIEAGRIPADRYADVSAVAYDAAHFIASRSHWSPTAQRALTNDIARIVTELPPGVSTDVGYRSLAQREIYAVCERHIEARSSGPECEAVQRRRQAKRLRKSARQREEREQAAAAARSQEEGERLAAAELRSPLEAAVYRALTRAGMPVDGPEVKVATRLLARNPRLTDDELLAAIGALEADYKRRVRSALDRGVPIPNRDDVVASFFGDSGQR